jgi:hypothetical protein
MYRSLDAAKIVETCRGVQREIETRFPGTGLSQIAGELTGVSEQAAALSVWLSRPQWFLRTLAGLGILAVLTIVIATFSTIDVQPTFGSIAEFLQGSEAAINEVVFLGIAIYFFLSLETRLKRRRALQALHVLRSLAHIVDLHQITKDPERLAPAAAPGETAERLPPADLARYLDCCSDLLALLSKIAALYVQQFNDPVTLSAVNELENLTSGLSRKIWQKIMILDRIMSRPASPPVAGAPTAGGQTA